MRLRLAVGLALLGAGSLAAQNPLPEPAIEDNSFLIEEAYNQEPGVVQHISTVTLTGPERKDAAVGFTQEWPLRGQRHQLSYSLLYQIQQGDAPDGFGDLLLNYRQQLRDSDLWAFAPRLSLLLPTGSERKGLGAGTLGGQVNLPVSVRIGPVLAAHLNAGMQVLARVRDSAAASGSTHHTLTTYTLGASLIGPVTRPVNLMLEFVQAWTGAVQPAGGVTHEGTSTLNPGVRFALNLGETQIVPGVGIPITFGEGEHTTGVLFYFSVEHPFRHDVGQQSESD
ncbi:MAG: transporter [Gemmatimonadales bacterium]